MSPSFDLFWLDLTWTLIKNNSGNIRVCGFGAAAEHCWICLVLAQRHRCVFSWCIRSYPCTSTQCCRLMWSSHGYCTHLRTAGDDAGSPPTRSFLMIIISSCRVKGHPADVSNGVGKEPALQPEPTSTHIPPPHYCEMKTSRLPTLPEEESPELKTPDPVPVVGEEAERKDDAAEVRKK